MFTTMSADSPEAGLPPIIASTGTPKMPIHITDKILTNCSSSLLGALDSIETKTTRVQFSAVQSAPSITRPVGGALWKKKKLGYTRYPFVIQTVFTTERRAIPKRDSPRTMCDCVCVSPMGSPTVASKKVADNNSDNKKSYYYYYYIIIIFITIIISSCCLLFLLSFIFLINDALLLLLCNIIIYFIFYYYIISTTQELANRSKTFA